ncbi:MAG: ATP-dependent Clp protease, protease subunit [Patescibacteria group bacterium]|jgi:ATP-dependent protease ClpP protease subunit|nr:ATP-dependent Clp protease, protease subunit [Patescibacteria group bacterium]
MADKEKPSLPFFLSEKEVCGWTGHWHAIRRVLVSGELNSESLKRTALELVKLDFISSDPITLMIDSGGGSVTPTHQLEDTISILNSPVDALMIGSCASMAVDLMQMCRRRLMLPSARILVHYVRNDQRWICDDLDQLDGDIKYFQERMREIAERRLELYQKRTGLTPGKIKDLFRQGEIHQTYFSAKQAVEMNLADEIVTDFKLFPRKQDEEKK